MATPWKTLSVTGNAKISKTQLLNISGKMKNSIGISWQFSYDVSFNSVVYNLLRDGDSCISDLCKVFWHQQYMFIFLKTLTVGEFAFRR